MISIVMPYFNRQYQLNKTLQTMAQSECRDFNVVIIDDNSPVTPLIPKLPFEVRILKLSTKTWTNCAPVYNMGFNYAIDNGADIIIIQSPECYHVGDVISHASGIKEDQYMAFGCFQIDKQTTFKKHDIIDLSKRNNFKVSHNNNGLGQNAWWNHSVYNRVPQYWCCAITRNNLLKLNGIDERFAFGYAYEDGYFVHQVENLGLRIDIIDYPFVVHQWHEHAPVNDIGRLVSANFRLYNELINDNNVRSKHLITPDLCGI